MAGKALEMQAKAGERWGGVVLHVVSKSVNGSALGRSCILVSLFCQYLSTEEAPSIPHVTSRLDRDMSFGIELLIEGGCAGPCSPYRPSP